MPLLVTSVPNLAQGVSQQPDNLRYPGQCDEQINAWSTVVEGLVKRPNTRWVNQFNSNSVNEANQSKLFTHFVKRDEQNKYCVTVSLGSSVSIGQVGVIDLETGNKVSVATTSIANSYLSGITNPLADLRALTVADYTFLVNTKKQVAIDTESSSGVPNNEALIVVKLGDYDKLYSIYINDILVPFSTLHGSEHNPGTTYPASYKSGPSTGGDAFEADTEHIAQDLAQLISAAYGTTRSGITDITFSDDSSNWLQGGIFIRNGFHELRPPKLPLKVEFVVKQNSPNPSNPSSTFVNRSAKGFCEVENGVITDFIFTNSGDHYNSDTVTYPLSVQITQYGWRGDHWFPLSLDSGTPPAAPSTMTPTVATIEPFIVEREGSVIRIKQTKSVSNGGSYYLLKEPHIANSDNEPGVGQDWETFWEVTTSSSGATAWSSGTDYILGTDFDIRTTDGLSNEGLEAVYKEVSSITDLPKQCFNNFSVKVKGDADIDQDDYYVSFSTDNKTNFGKGSWVETVGWKQDESKTGLIESIQTKLDSNTMPLTLVPIFTGDEITSFKLQTPEEDETQEPNAKKGWRARSAGDDNTNPFPSFVGSKINDVFFFKNRLGFLTDSNVIFSEADEYFNFFRTTNQQLLDSAPIDVGLSHTKVAVLQYALPFQEKLMLFSKQSQFVLRGADVLSPKTVAISPVTEYDISDGIAPLALGSYIYFPFNRGQYEGMFEYFVDNNTEVFEAEEITSQIPKYIPSKLRAMAGSASESMVVLQNATDLKTLYVYKYFWSNKEKIQSAWQKWTFNDNVTGFDFIDSTLYLILNAQQLVEMPVENALTDEGLEYTLLLDNRVDGDGKTVSYSSQTNRTTISNLPTGYGATVDNMTVFTKGGSERNVVASSSGTSVEIDGFIASYVKYNDVKYKCIQTHTSSDSILPTNTAYWTPNDDVPNPPTWNSGVLYNDQYYFVVGKPYNMLYRFSNQALKQPTERGGRSASDYTFQNIRNGSIEYADTGHFTVEVTPRFRDTYTYVYNPTLLSSISTLDRFTPESGHFRFGVQCRPEEATIEVKSSSALPVKLLAAEFESMVASRSRRYGA